MQKNKSFDDLVNILTISQCGKIINVFSALIINEKTRFGRVVNLL